MRTHTEAGLAKWPGGWAVRCYASRPVLRAWIYYAAWAARLGLSEHINQMRNYWRLSGGLRSWQAGFPGRVPQTVLVPCSPPPLFGFRNWSVAEKMYVCKRAGSRFQAQASRRVTKALDIQAEKQKIQIQYVGGKCFIPLFWESNWVHSVTVSRYDTVCYHKKTWWGIKSFSYLLSSPPLGWLYFGISFVSTEVLLLNWHWQILSWHSCSNLYSCKVLFLPFLYKRKILDDSDKIFAFFSAGGKLTVDLNLKQRIMLKITPVSLRSFIVEVSAKPESCIYPVCIWSG